jgi:hypothetical protein
MIAKAVSEMLAVTESLENPARFGGAPERKFRASAYSDPIRHPQLIHSRQRTYPQLCG